MQFSHLPIKEEDKTLNIDLFFHDHRISGYITSLTVMQHFCLR